MIGRFFFIFLLGIMALFVPNLVHAETNLSVKASPYYNGGLFTFPLLPREGEEVRIFVRADAKGDYASRNRMPQASITITASDDSTVLQRLLTLTETGTKLEASVIWNPEKNGVYRVSAELDPLNIIDETSETDNSAQIALPVLVEGKVPHFVWYRRPAADIRWMTCITNADTRNFEQLTERGIRALKWEYGGMSWNRYDRKEAEENPEVVLEELEDLFYAKYSGESPMAGLGIDECGGYPETFQLAKSVASMKALARVRKENPKRFFTVWHAGALGEELAGVYRQAVDLLLMETYIWSAIPKDLKTDEIYQIIQDRLGAVVRGSDMIVPAYGNHCHTLIALDLIRPENMDPG